MRDNPLVSVLMTAYNREKYIAEAVESVLASTYTHFELIVVDDGSKDSTVEIARRYASHDPRVKVYVNENNLGDYPNRNKAASYAQGKYIKYVDADDAIYPWGLALLVRMMEQFPDAGWGLCSLEQDAHRAFPFQLNPHELYEYNYLGPGLFHKAPLSSIVSKKVFDAVGGFRNIRMAGDFEMWHRLGQKHNVVLMPHGIVWSRVHGEQEMNSYKQFQNVYEEIGISYLKDGNCPLDRSASGKVLQKLKGLVRRQFIAALIRMRLSWAVNRWQLLKKYS